MGGNSAQGMKEWPVAVYHVKTCYVRWLQLNLYFELKGIKVQMGEVFRLYIFKIFNISSLKKKRRLLAQFIFFSFYSFSNFGGTRGEVLVCIYINIIIKSSLEYLITL